jgi:outer membrane lipase/esterase
MKFRTASVTFASLVSSASLMLWAGMADAQSLNQFVGFGDSAIDSGWYFTHRYSTNATVQALYNAAMAAGGGYPTTPGGQMNSTILASLLGLTVIPVGEPGGTNYAAGGATDIPYPNSTTLAPTTVSQIHTYLGNVNGAANPNALYMLSSGGNDILDAICPGGVCVSNATQLATTSAAALSAAIAQLHAAGGRYFIVSILLGAGPASSSASPLAGVERTYNQALYAGLAAAGVDFVPLSGKIIADAIGVNPALFGLTNIMPGSSVTHQGGACVNPNPGNGTNGTIATAWAALCITLVAPNAAQTYLYTDDLHYSAAGQVIEGDYSYSLLVAPSEISYLAEVPVETRTAVVDAILNQIPISQRQRAVGSTNAWITGDLSSLHMGNYPGFPSDPGTPGMVTAGVDYLFSTNWLIGAAVSVGTTTQDFSLGGDFRQNEYAVSGYAAFAKGPLWFDMIGSYGGLRYDVNRIVPIGIATISNTGSTSGDNASFAAEVGYDFTTGVGGSSLAPVLPVKAPTAAAFAVTHGPVAGIVLQRIYVDGFAETDSFSGDPSGGFTALSYAGQLRNSAVTELGYQASTNLGIWHPYGKLVWNHEFAATDRMVTAMEPEIAFAPAFALPAVAFGKDWGTATVGTTTALGRGITAYASFSGEFGQRNVATYGGQLGVNVALNAPAAAPIAAH